MRIAFHAPLKSADHPVPSGDRNIARALLRALDHAGHETIVASRLRSFDGTGDPMRQARLQRLGARIAQRLVARWRGGDAHPPDAWLTYHLYHKAPDVIGPAVARELCIPYVVAEASISPRQRDGRWARGHALAVAAVCAADAIVCLNPRDVPQVSRVRGSDAAVTLLPPFIDIAAFSAPAAGRARTRGPTTRLIAVAMMRDGAKLASYRALAAAVGGLGDLDWSLRIVGDGPARTDVERAFAGMADRVSFMGARDVRGVASLLGDSDLFVWPAIDEAIGLVLVEAQACGLPVVAGDSAGVAAVVDAGRTGLLAPEGDIGAFAAAIRSLLTDVPLRDRLGAAAARYVRARHDLPAAAAAFDTVLRDAVARRRFAVSTQRA